MPEPEVVDPDVWHDLQPVLDRELSRLPDKYRAAVVLCDLEGKTYKEAARQLGCPEGTLAARLARSRALLAKRLARHGLAVSGGTVAAMLAENAASACVPTSVTATTAKAASLLAAGQAAAAGAISVQVAALTEGVLKAMLISKLKTGTALCFTLGLVLLIGTGWGYGTFAADKPQSEKHVDSLRYTLLVLDKQFWEAGGKHDVDTLSKLIAHDFVSIAADGTKFTKDATLQNFRTMRTADLKLTSEREVIRVDEHAAMLTYQGKFKVYAKSGELIATLHQCMTSCWVQRDGGWFVVFSRVTDLPTPAAAVERMRSLFEVDPSRFSDLTTSPTTTGSNLQPTYTFGSSTLRPSTSSNLEFSKYSAFPNMTSSSCVPNTFGSSTLHPSVYSTVDFPNRAGFPIQVLQQPTGMRLSAEELRKHLGYLTTVELHNQPAQSLPHLIDIVLKAHGGEDKLNALTTFTEKVIVRTEVVSTAEHFVQLPGKYRFETKTGPAGKTQTHTFILNAGQRWHLLNGMRVELLGAERTTEYWEDYLKYYGPRAVLRLKDPGNELHLLGESKIGDRAAVAIRLTSKTGVERKMHFDKETALLLKEECAAQGFEIVYKDYKTMGGFPIAQKRVTKIVGHEGETEVVDFKVVDKLDPKLFEKP